MGSSAAINGGLGQALHTRHTYRGIGLKLVATIIFTLMYALVRLVGRIPVGEIIFFRSSLAMIPLFVLSAATVGPRKVVHSTHPVRCLAWAGVSTVGMFLGFSSLRWLSLVEFTAISFLAPIFMVVLAPFILHERVGPYRAFAVAVGFAGVLLMLAPQGASLNFGSASSLGAAMAISGWFLTAFVLICIRQLSATESSETIAFYYFSVPAVLGLISMLWWRAPLSWEQFGLLVTCGLLGGLAQIALTYAYRYAESSLIAPFDYANMIWAIGLGFFILGETPQPVVILGSLVVIGAGLFIAWREYLNHRRMALVNDPSPTGA